VFYPASQHLRGNHVSWGTHGERKARAYYGGLKAEPPAGSKGRVSGEGQGGQPPGRWKPCRIAGVPWKRQNCPHSLYFANSVHLGLLCIFDVFRLLCGSKLDQAAAHETVDGREKDSKQKKRRHTQDPDIALDKQLLKIWFRCYSCNSRKHCRIFILFGTHVTEKVSNQ